MLLLPSSIHSLAGEHSLCTRVKAPRPMFQFSEKFWIPILRQDLRHLRTLAMQSDLKTHVCPSLHWLAGPWISSPEIPWAKRGHCSGRIGPWQCPCLQSQGPGVCKARGRRLASRADPTEAKRHRVSLVWGGGYCQI